MINPYEFAFRKVKKIVNYDATEDEKLEAVGKTMAILATKITGKNWFYSHPSFNDKFYSDRGTSKTGDNLNMNNPWHIFFTNLLFNISTIADVKKEVWYLENSVNYRDWIVENVRKKRVAS